MPFLPHNQQRQSIEGKTGTSYKRQKNLNTHTHPTILRPSWFLSGTSWVSQHQKGKTTRDLPEQEIVGGSGISWAIGKFAP